MANRKPLIMGVIPARYKSKRFPGKVLADISGKPMIQHVYERSKKSKLLNDVIVATDDTRIKRAVEKFNGNVVMTSKKHKSGSDRIAEVAKKLNADIIVNIQGDEPLINPKMIDQVVTPLLHDSNIYMSTLIRKITDPKDIKNPNIVKVVVDKNNFALYFSRSMIPYQDVSESSGAYKHIGIYAYRKDFLLKFSKMKQSKLEKIEKLEQLRVLENGYKIKVVETNYNTISVDTPKDIKKVERTIKIGKSG